MQEESYHYSLKHPKLLGNWLTAREAGGCRCENHPKPTGSLTKAHLKHECRFEGQWATRRTKLKHLRRNLQHHEGKSGRLHTTLSLFQTTSGPENKHDTLFNTGNRNSYKLVIFTIKFSCNNNIKIKMSWSCLLSHSIFQERLSCALLAGTQTERNKRVHLYVQSKLGLAVCLVITRLKQSIHVRSYN